MRYFVFILLKDDKQWTQVQVDSQDSAKALMWSLDGAVNVAAARIVEKLPFNKGDDT